MRARTRLLTLAVCTMVAGCGGGGDGGSADETPDNKQEAIERCREEAAKLSGDSRQAAEAVCEAGESGNTNEVRDAARELCLKQVEQIPDATAKRQAEQACEPGR